MNESTEIVIRGVVAFIFLILLAQLIGKQLLGQMSYHHFIAAISIGSIAGNTAFNTKIKLVFFILSLVVFSAITFIFTVWSLKSRKARRWIAGEPVVLIENGRIQEHRMKKLYYTIDALNQGLRKKDIFDLNEVEYAMLEADGTLSVKKKTAFLGVTKSDLSLSTPPAVTAHPIELIRERTILEDNLAQHQLTKEWLLGELTKRGLSLEDIFYGVKGTDGYVFLDCYQDRAMNDRDARAEP